MKQKTITLLLIAALITSPLALAKKKKDQSPQFQFSCMNYWNQEKLVLVEAPTEDEARQKLKTDPALYEEYRNECSSLGMVKQPPVAKTVKKDTPVTPAE